MIVDLTITSGDLGDTVNSSTEVLTIAIRRILRPLVRLLLRHGVSFAPASDLLAETYIEVAAKDFGIAGRKQSVSRISTLTGLSRKKVTQALNTPELDLGTVNQQYNRAARVLTGWIRDPAYLNSKNRPLTLPFDGAEPSFSSLVRRFSGDIPPRAIADELMRVGSVKQLRDGNLKLIERAYVPAQLIDEKLNILGTDVEDLIKTIDHNIYHGDEPFFQRKVAYDAIPDSAIPELRVELKQLAQGALEKMDRVLAQHDTDVTSESKSNGSCRLGVGIYYFEDLDNDS